MRKKILFLSEATHLNTGYAVYSRNVLNYLHKTGKYDIAELAVYGDMEYKKNQTKWKVYPNMPTNDEEMEIYQKNPVFQFGAWRMERALLDHKATHVLCIKDVWMDSFIRISPFRKHFNWIWMPACDGTPQNEEWISYFANADGLFSYSEWGSNVLKNQGGDLLKVLGFASPAATEDFKPLNRNQIKQKYGLDPSIKIIGMVSRNQRRKLYPALFNAFKQYLDASGDKQTYLLLHTSYPDNGWNFGKVLNQYDIGHRVIFTYKCNCGHIEICPFSDTIQYCPKCHNFGLTMPNVKNGFSNQELAEVYNMMDLYVQYSNCEGFGIGSVEAAACGIPVAAVDYSAMSDTVKKLNGFPIKVAAFYNELETGVDRAVPDDSSFVSILQQFLSQPYEIRARKGRETRLLYEKHYSWEDTAKKWEKAIDSLDVKSWDTPPRFSTIPKDIPKFKNNADFLNWTFAALGIDESLVNSYSYNLFIRDLNWQIFKPSPGKYLFSDGSAHNDSSSHYSAFSPQHVINILTKKMEENNFWENVRIGNIKLPNEEWLA